MGCRVDLFSPLLLTHEHCEGASDFPHLAYARSHAGFWGLRKLRKCHALIDDEGAHILVLEWFGQYLVGTFLRTKAYENMTGPVTLLTEISDYHRCVESDEGRD